MRIRALPLAGALIALVAATAIVGVAPPAPADAGTRSDRTSRTEARRVDRVTTHLKWYPCQGGVECATAALPRDYDHPHGPKIKVAVVRSKARDQAHKIGTLFVNPGGPGGSGTALAANASGYFSDAILDNFDVVGFDPRGTNYSDQVKCFSSTRTQQKVFDKSTVKFPMTGPEEAAYISASTGLAKACSSHGKPLTASVSTAEVARDMDVLRRTLGDKRLTYFGVSYGSYLGEVYANMFPDRVRALAIDGVIDPIAWAGTSKTRNQVLEERLNSAVGAYGALHTILLECAQVGPDRCSFADGTDPVTKFDNLANRLKTTPYTETNPDTGDTLTITYADFVSEILGALYSPYGWATIVDTAQTIDDATSQPHARQRPDTARVSNAWSALQRTAKAAGGIRAYGFPYDNSAEAYTSVLCTDTIAPTKKVNLSAKAAAADVRAPYFGRAWFWASTPCSTTAWKARDEDRYGGRFTKITSAPVLIVGNYWDPATNYADAVSTSKIMPNNRLLSSDNWGHTAYGTSDCATAATDNYLLQLDLPEEGTVCHASIQPFADDDGEDAIAVQTSRQRAIDGFRPLTTHIPHTMPSR